MHKYTAIPIHNNYGMFTVAAKVNGHAANLYLDTGSSSSVIDQRRLGDLAIDLDQEGSQNNGVAVGTDSLSYTPITIARLQLANYTIKGVHGVSMNMDDMNSQSPEPLDGILGQDVLLNNNVLLSFADSSLLLPNSHGHAVNIEKKQMIRLQRLHNGFFVIAVLINAGTLNLLLDSGSPDIILDTNTTHLLMLSQQNNAPKIQAATADGSPYPITQIPVDSIAIGSHQLQRSMLMATDLSHVTKRIATDESIAIAGTLGLKALKDVGAVLDPARAILYID